MPLWHDLEVKMNSRDLKWEGMLSTFAAMQRKKGEINAFNIELTLFSIAQHQCFPEKQQPID